MIYVIKKHSFFNRHFFFLCQVLRILENYILKEINKLPNVHYSNNKKLNVKFRKGKEFWNPELQQLWRESCRLEKQFINFKAVSQNDLYVKNLFRLDFKQAQKTFDKRFRFFKRQFQRNELRELESNARTDPVLMWASLKKLSEPLDRKTILEIVRDDQSISGDIKEVLDRWFRDIFQPVTGA